MQTETFLTSNEMLHKYSHITCDSIDIHASNSVEFVCNISYSITKAFDALIQPKGKAC